MPPVGALHFISCILNVGFGTRGNGGRTTVVNSTLLVSQLPNILSSRVESFSAKKYDENGEKQRKGMLTVLEMLREKYKP